MLNLQMSVSNILPCTIQILLPEYRQCIPDTLVLPDEVRQSARIRNARLFSRWFEWLRGGKFVVVVVISNLVPTTTSLDCHRLHG